MATLLNVDETMKLRYFKVHHHVLVNFATFTFDAVKKADKKKKNRF